MTRVNLKQLKEALNKMPDAKLVGYHLMHDMVTEDPDIKLDWVYVGADEEWERFASLQEHPDFKVLIDFRDGVLADMKKIQICQLDEEQVDGYRDDC